MHVTSSALFQAITQSSRILVEPILCNQINCCTSCLAAAFCLLSANCLRLCQFMTGIHWHHPVLKCTTTSREVWLVSEEDDESIRQQWRQFGVFRTKPKIYKNTYFLFLEYEGDFISKVFGFCNRIYIHDEIQQHLPLGLVVRQQMIF